MAFSNGYTYRKKITVDPTKVSGSGSLTDFPFLVSHTDAAIKTVANGGKVEHSLGYDIRFETSGGTELDYERILYVASTGQIIVWLQATIDGTTNTEVYMYYGNSSISTDQSDPAGTWDANYKGVWHMIEDPTSVEVRASSKNDDASGTAVSVTAPTGTVAGDFVVCIVHGNGQTTIADNNGSTPFTEDINDYKPNTTNGHTVSVFSRTIVAGDPSTYNFTLGASGRWSVIAITFKSDGVIAYDVAPNTANATNTDTAASGQITVPAITTVAPDVIHVTFGCWDTSAYGTISTPSGYTLLQNANTDGEPLHASYKLIATPASTGTPVIDNTEFAARIGLSFSVKATGQIPDSTSSNYDMTSAGAMTAADSVTGQVYKGIDFDGSNDYLINTAWASVISGNGARSMECWFYDPSLSNGNWVSWGAASGNQLSSLGDYAGDIGYMGYSNDIGYAGGAYDDGAWHHLMVTHDGSTLKVFLDGVERRSVSTSLSTTTAHDLYFGRFVGGGYFSGGLEEVRIGNTGRSVDWAITTYETAKNPSTFYSLGTEETSGGTAYDVVAAVGTFTLTGQNAGLSHGTKTEAETGTFSLTGQSAGLSHGTNIAAEQGTYALTGQNTNLSLSTTLALETGVFTLTGNDVNFTTGFVLACNAGSYTLTGQDATFNLGLTMALERGTFSIAGQDVGLSYGTKIDAATGTFVMTGQDASLSTQYVVLTETGGYLLTGQDAALTFSQIMTAEKGTFTLTGSDTALPIAYKINPETGTFTMTGNNVNLGFSSPSGAGHIIIGIAI